MRIDILTLFPEMFEPLKTSLLGKAIDKNILQINIVDIRNYTADKHKKCDDYPFGGGAGMLMTVQPIADAFKSIPNYEKATKIYMSPKGKTFKQNMVENYSTLEHIIILCGHYEGVDQRAIDLFIDEEISIGDYVLTGGEIPAMAFVDAVSRFVPGVLHSNNSVEEETFMQNLVEYPQYTRPKEYMGLCVPEVLLSGNHAEVDKWRYEQSLELTKKLRPDLLDKK